MFKLFPDLFVRAHEFFVEANVQRNRKLDNVMNSTQSSHHRLNARPDSPRDPKDIQSKSIAQITPGKLRRSDCLFAGPGSDSKADRVELARSPAVTWAHPGLREPGMSPARHHSRPDRGGPAVDSHRLGGFLIG